MFKNTKKNSTKNRIKELEAAIAAAESKLLHFRLNEKEAQINIAKMEYDILKASIELSDILNSEKK